MTTLALAADDLTTVGAVVTVVLVLLGALLAWKLTALVIRLVILVVVAALVVVVWHQRSTVEDKARARCSQGASFFGVHVDPQDACGRLGGS